MYFVWGAVKGNIEKVSKSYFVYYETTHTKKALSQSPT